MDGESNVAVARRLNRVLHARDYFSEGSRLLGICATAMRLEIAAGWLELTGWQAGWLAGWMHPLASMPAGRQRRVAGQPDGQTAVCRSVGVRGRSRARRRGGWRQRVAEVQEGRRAPGWDGGGSGGDSAE